MWNLDWSMQMSFHESPVFLYWDNQTKLVPDSFSCFSEFWKKEIEFSLQNFVTVSPL